MKELGRKLRKLCTLKEKRLNDKSNWLKRELHKWEWRQKKPRLSLMTFYSIELKVLDMLYNKHHMYLSLILSLSLSLSKREGLICGKGNTPYIIIALLTSVLLLTGLVTLKTTDTCSKEYRDKYKLVDVPWKPQYG